MGKKGDRVDRQTVGFVQAGEVAEHAVVEAPAAGGLMFYMDQKMRIFSSKAPSHHQIGFVGVPDGHVCEQLLVQLYQRVCFEILHDFRKKQRDEVGKEFRKKFFKQAIVFEPFHPHIAPVLAISFALFAFPSLLLPFKISIFLSNVNAIEQLLLLESLSVLVHPSKTNPMVRDRAAIHCFA